MECVVAGAAVWRSSSCDAEQLEVLPACLVVATGHVVGKRLLPAGLQVKAQVEARRHQRGGRGRGRQAGGEGRLARPAGGRRLRRVVA